MTVIPKEKGGDNYHRATGMSMDPPKTETLKI